MAEGIARAAAAVKKQPSLAASNDPAEWWEAAGIILSKEVDASTLGEPAITTKDNRTECHDSSDTTVESTLNQMSNSELRDLDDQLLDPSTALKANAFDVLMSPKARGKTATEPPSKKTPAKANAIRAGTSATLVAAPAAAAVPHRMIVKRKRKAPHSIQAEILRASWVWGYSKHDDVMNITWMDRSNPSGDPLLFKVCEENADQVAPIVILLPVVVDVTITAGGVYSVTQAAANLVDEWCDHVAEIKDK
jgi:hypothetical protein